MHIMKGISIPYFQKRVRSLKLLSYVQKMHVLKHTFVLQIGPLFCSLFSQFTMILIFYLVLLVFFTPFRNSCFVLCNNDKKHLLICRFQYRYTVTKVSALCLLTPIAACRYLAGFPEFRYQTRNPDCHFGIRPNTKYKNNRFIQPDRCSHPARCGIIANCI